jgi:hypothetical protein
VKIKAQLPKFIEYLQQEDSEEESGSEDESETED